jgi:hypothetical protein
MNNVTLATIELLTKKYADARKIVTERVNSLEDEVRSAYRRKMPGIRTAVAEAKDAQAELAQAIEQAKDLFVSPRSITIHGIKVGLAKGKGKIEWDDDDHVVRLIEKHFPEQADILIAVSKSPVKEALKNLTVSDLKKIGCSVEETGDCVIIRATDAEVDKLVKKILKEGVQEAA